jgi:hypothetical protein
MVTSGRGFSLEVQSRSEGQHVVGSSMLEGRGDAVQAPDQAYQLSIFDLAVSLWLSRFF